jgi:hypothetical protein
MLSWSDVDYTETPGEYPYLDGVAIIKDEDVAAWKRRPNAVFNVWRAPDVSSGKVRYVLGTYWVPSED